MAYAFVQQNANDNAATATTITVTLTPTAGNLLVFAISGDSLDTTSIAISDNLGSHNTFTQIATDLVSTLDQRCAWWFAANCKGGATTFTATFSASTRFRTIYVAEYSGIATTTPFLNGARAENIVPGTGADAVSSGNANATSQPALVWGFSIDVNGGTTPTAGTGFTSRAGVWSTATALGRPEDERVTATGNVAATFTATTGTDTHATGVGIFAEAASPAPDDDSMPAVPRPPWSVPWPPIRAGIDGDDIPGTTVNAAPDDDAPVLAVPRALAPTIRVTGDDDLPSAASPTMIDDEVALQYSPTLAPRPQRGWTDGDDLPSATALLTIEDDSALIARSVALPPPRAPAPAEDALPIAAAASIFPLTIDAGGRFFRQNDGAPFLICADTTWSLAVDIPLTGAANINTYLSTITGQGFNAVMMNVIEHHYTVVKPPQNQASRLPFTKRLDGATYTGSPNGTTGTAGTQGQFAADSYSIIATQAPDPTFINNAYWLDVETILDACLANNVAVFVWVCYFGFHNDDEGWLSEMVEWNAVTGAGGFTGFPFANGAKSKMWNYGAWLADRWKAYPHLVWVLGGDYGSNTQTLSAPQKAAVEQLADGMKSVAGQASTFFTAHWDRPAIATDTTLATVTFDTNLAYCDEAVAELTRRGFARTPAIPTFLGEYYYEADLFGGSAPYRKYVYWGFLGGIAGGFYGHEQLWRFDDGTPGTDWTTLLSTQATLDASRQFVFWKSKPWHRLIPNGLGGIGTLITAGGGTASPQSTNYVAAACTPQGDLLLAYIPPAHTGSVTVDMSKLTAQITANWFDPTDSSITAIGSFANTGTHAFTPPATNSAGDTDFLLVLETSGAVTIEEISPVQLPVNGDVRLNNPWWKPWFPYDPEDLPITPTSAIDDHEDVLGRVLFPRPTSWFPGARSELDDDVPSVSAVDDDAAPPMAGVAPPPWLARVVVSDDEIVIAQLDEDYAITLVPRQLAWSPARFPVDDDLPSVLLDDDAPGALSVARPWSGVVPVLAVDDDMPVAATASTDDEVAPVQIPPAQQRWAAQSMPLDGDDLPSAPAPTMVDDQASTAPVLAQFVWSSVPRQPDPDDFPAAAAELEDEGAWLTAVQQNNGWCAILRQFCDDDLLPPPAVLEDLGWTLGTGWLVLNRPPAQPDPEDLPIAGPPGTIVDEDAFAQHPPWPLVWNLRATVPDDDIGGIDTGPAPHHVRIPGIIVDPEVLVGPINASTEVLVGPLRSQEIL